MCNCQSVSMKDEKALMSGPNTTLGLRIMKVLQPTLTDSDFERPA